ncbi:hypothetical protein Tco_0526480 [Tanacetum coccineum]
MSPSGKLKFPLTDHSPFPNLSIRHRYVISKLHSPGQSQVKRERRRIKHYEVVDVPKWFPDPKTSPRTNESELVKLSDLNKRFRGRHPMLIRHDNFLVWGILVMDIQEKDKNRSQIDKAEHENRKSVKKSQVKVNPEKWI